MLVDVNIVADDTSAIEALWPTERVVGWLRRLLRANGIRGASHRRAVAEYGRKLGGFGEGTRRGVCVGRVDVVVGCRRCCGSSSSSRHPE